jgi:hypothetical protein
MKLQDYLNSNKPILVNFSTSGTSLINEKFVESTPSLVLTNFSNLVSTPESVEAVNFSIQIYIRDRKQNARQVINRRVREVARYINSTKEDKLKDVIDFVIDYLRVYLNNILFKWLTDVQNGKFTNLMLALGINQYIKDKPSLIKLQTTLRRLAKELNSKGYMSKIIQDLVQEQYTKVIEDFFKSIEDRYVNEDKKGWLTGEKTSEELIESDIKDEEVKEPESSEDKNKVA